MIIQQAVIMLWSSITGTQSGVLLPQHDAINDPNALQDGLLSLSPRKCKQGDSFKSDLPQLISSDDLPNTICYRDIELFYLKDLDGVEMFSVPSLNFIILRAGQRVLMG